MIFLINFNINNKNYKKVLKSGLFLCYMIKKVRFIEIFFKLHNFKILPINIIGLRKLFSFPTENENKPL